MEPSFTLRQVAEILHCDLQTAYKLVTTGALKGFKVGSRWRIRPSELAKFMGGEEELAA